MFTKPNGKHPSYHSVLRWAEQYDGTRASLVRKEYTPKNEVDHLNFKKNRKNQWDYIMGHLFSVKNGTFASAHEDLVSDSEILGWGKPMTLAAAYHKYKNLGKFKRPKELEDLKKHYEKFALYAKSQRILGNERWQIDEFEYSVMGLGTNETTFFGAVVVDRLSQVVRYLELSLKHINKVSFMRAWKGALLGNPAIGTALPSKPLAVQVDNAQWHEPEAAKDAYMDFRQSGEDLNVTIIWNDEYCPQQNCMVENWNGQFKKKFVPGFRCFVEEIAPARTAEDWIAHMENLQSLAESYCLKWNNKVLKNGLSRLDTLEKYAVEGTFQVTPSEIDKAVRITVDRSMTQYGVVFGDQRYHGPKLLLEKGDKLQIRIRPEGPGPDVEAYVGARHLGTLTQDTDGLMDEKLNSCYKKAVRGLTEERKQLRKRFLGFKRQILLKDYPEGSKMYNLILSYIESGRPLSELPKELPEVRGGGVDISVDASQVVYSSEVV